MPHRKQWKQIPAAVADLKKSIIQGTASPRDKTRIAVYDIPLLADKFEYKARTVAATVSMNADESLNDSEEAHVRRLLEFRKQLADLHEHERRNEEARRTVRGGPNQQIPVDNASPQEDWAEEWLTETADDTEHSRKESYSVWLDPNAIVEVHAKEQPPRAAALRTSRRATDLLDGYALVLPQRIVNEELGDFIEDINRRAQEGQGRLKIYVRVTAAVFWTAVNAIGYVMGNLLGKRKGA